MRNKAGCCVLSGEKVFDVLSTFTRGPRSGDPDRLGPPHTNAWRLTVLLIDGSTTNVTVHEDVLPDVELRLSEMWHNVMEAHAFERENWKDNGAKAFTPEQVRKAYKDSYKLVHNVPIGIMKKERWSDLNGNP